MMSASHSKKFAGSRYSTDVCTDYICIPQRNLNGDNFFRCSPNYFSPLSLVQVQRQLQLRIEAQGKYLQKIIEEQQKLSGVLVASELDQEEKRQESGSSADEPSTPQKKLRSEQ